MDAARTASSDRIRAKRPVEAALHILTGMCEYGVLKQTHIEGVESWTNRPIINGTYSYNTHHE